MPRIVLVISLVFLVIFGLVGSFFLCSQVLPLGFTVLATPTPAPTPTPTPTPTPEPSPTIVPTTAEVRIVPTYLIDANSGNVLFDEASDTRMPMASTAKIMTAILALENRSLDDWITITQDELNEVPDGDYSLAMLQPDDQMSMRDLLYALLLPSGCDAAQVIAHEVGGSSSSFVDMMNAKAQALGLANTHYTSPAGYNDPNNYSTPADLVKLARYAMGIQAFATIVSQTNFVLDANQYHHRYDTWNNTNALLGMYPGVDGIKTGNSNDAGYSLVFSASRNGHRLIGAIMHDTSDELYIDAMQDLDNGFAKV